MGCDGGTIPTRDEMVRTKKKKPKAEREIANSAKWNHCHLSQQALIKPVVADLLGFLYNKDALIEFLLERAKYEHGPQYVKSLKDVKELSIVANPGYSANKQETSNNMNGLNTSPWICPISGVEMNGMYKFCYLFSCGCSFAQKTIKTISQAGEMKCLKCDKPYTSNDLIIMNPDDEDLKLNEQKRQSRIELASQEKAEKSKKASLAHSSSSDSNKSDEIKTEPKILPEKVTEKPPKRNHEVDEKSTAKKHKPVSVQDDPNASAVYKSLFNTCDKAKNQQKAHWVTFNPQFY